MTDPTPAETPTPSGSAKGGQLPTRAKTALRALLFLLLSSAVGAIAGVIWWRVVDLPLYRVGPDGGASTTERGLAEYVGGDAWFSLIGFVVGIALGLLAWRVFRRLGWPVVPLVVVGSVIASLICWWIGWKLGPGPFPPRLAEAQPGALVPIELTVRAPVAVLVWPFGAVLVTLLGSSLGRDDEEPRPIFPNRGRQKSGSV